MFFDVTELPDLELLAEAAENAATNRRVAAELGSGEIRQAKAEGQDVRTRAVRVVDMLGEAARLVELAAAVRTARPAALLDPPVAVVNPVSAFRGSSSPTAPTGPATPSQAPTAAHAPPAGPVPARASAEPEPTDPHAAETLANLRRAGEAALGPDGEHLPAAAETSEVPA